MKTLIAFYSRSGNTQKVARSLSERLNCDIERIHDLKNRAGIIGWIFGGIDGMKKSTTEIGRMEKDPSDYDLVILGTPIWVNTPPAMRTYLLKFSGHFKKAAFFCTMGGSGSENLFKEMELLCGVKPATTLAIKEIEVKTNKFIEKTIEFIKELR